jgi:quercetin dioxygenase-like cupin family protein
MAAPQHPRTIPDPVYDRSAPQPSIKPLYSHALKNVPGYSAIGLEVTFPPLGATPPHRHGGASVTGIIIKGTAYNKMNDEPTYVLEAGASWYEAPGCHHKVSANASGVEEMVLHAHFVVESRVVEEGGLAALVVVDEEFREVYGPKV